MCSSGFLPRRRKGYAAWVQERRWTQHPLQKPAATKSATEQRGQAFSAMMSVLAHLFARQLLATKQLTPIQNSYCCRTVPLRRRLPASDSLPRSQILDGVPLLWPFDARRSRASQSHTNFLDLLRYARRPRTGPRRSRTRCSTANVERYLSPSHQSHRRSADSRHARHGNCRSRRPSQSWPHRLEKSALLRSDHHRRALPRSRCHQPNQGWRRARPSGKCIRSTCSGWRSSALGRFHRSHFSRKYRQVRR